MNSQSDSLLNNLKRSLPGVLISLVAVVVLIQFVSWQEMLAALAAARPGYLVLAFLLQIVALLLRAVAWKIMLDHKTTVKESFLTICEGYLLNTILPLKLGELGKAVLMGKKTRLGFFYVFSTVFIERAFDVGILAVVLLLVLPVAIGAEWAKPTAVILFLVVLVCFAVLFIAARNQKTFENLLTKFGGKYVWFQKLVLPKLEALLNGLSVLRSPKKFLGCVGLYLGCWLVWTVVYYVLLLSFFPSIRFWQAAFLEGILALGVSVPSAPAGLGVYEATTVAALSLYGVNQSQALAFALVSHLVQILSTTFFGIWGFIREGLSVGELLTQIRNTQNNQEEIVMKNGEPKTSEEALFTEEFKHD